MNIEKQETTTLNLHTKQGQNICIIANKTSDRKYCKDNKSKFENTVCFKDLVMLHCN